MHGHHTEIVPIGIAVDLCKVGAVLPDVSIERRHTVKALAETLSVPLQGEFYDASSHEGCKGRKANLARGKLPSKAPFATVPTLRFFVSGNSLGVEMPD